MSAAGLRGTIETRLRDLQGAVESLAYEARTANLIAILQPIQCGNETLSTDLEWCRNMLKVVEERLGVQEDGTVK